MDLRQVYSPRCHGLLFRNITFIDFISSTVPQSEGCKNFVPAETSTEEFSGFAYPHCEEGDSIGTFQADIKKLLTSNSLALEGGRTKGLLL